MERISELPIKYHLTLNGLRKIIIHPPQWLHIISVEPWMLPWYVCMQKVNSNFQEVSYVPLPLLFLVPLWHKMIATPYFHPLAMIALLQLSCKLKCVLDMKGKISAAKCGSFFVLPRNVMKYALYHSAEARITEGCCCLFFADIQIIHQNVRHKGIKFISI